MSSTRPKRPEAPEAESAHPAKRRRLSRESDASSPSTIVPDSQPQVDSRSEFSDTPTPVAAYTTDVFFTDDGNGTETQKRLPRLPDALLLLMIPQLVLEPPSSPNYIRALYLSWLAMRKCLRMNLTADLEVRACTGLAEVGILVLDAELVDPWVQGMENEVEKAVVRGLALAKKHPTFTCYVAPLTYLQIRLATMQKRTKYALSLSKAALAPSPNSTPCSSSEWLHYFHHSHVLSSLAPAALANQVAHLANTPGVDPLYTRMHALLRLSFLLVHQPDDFRSECDSLLASFPDVESVDLPDAYILLITQVLSLVHIASTPITPDSSSVQASLLGDMPVVIDTILSAPSVSMTFASKSNPILFPFPPRKLLVAHACLAAAIASRDPSGRKTARGIWAAEGLKLFDEEMDELPRWYSLRDRRAVERQLDQVKAHLLVEFVSVSIMRSEFNVAQHHLNLLVAHTESANLFSSFSPIITLLHGRLAHSVSSVSRAKECYIACVYLSKQHKDNAMRLAANLDLIGLRLGLGEDVQAEAEELLLEISDCKAECVKEPALVFQAVVTKEIHKSKQFLKRALDMATLRSDNYLRLLILCITASHYLLTKPDRALNALQACRQLCLSLGAPPGDEDRDEDGKEQAPAQAQTIVHAGYGNAPVGLWVGEQCVEILQRQGKEKQVRKQEAVNASLREAWEKVLQTWTESAREEE